VTTDDNAFLRYADTLRNVRYSSAAIAAAADKLREAAAEIRRLKAELASADRVSTAFAKTAAERGAKLKVVREWMEKQVTEDELTVWEIFSGPLHHEEAAEWFYDDGFPR
jgi:hypothetical protein